MTSRAVVDGVNQGVGKVQSLTGGETGGAAETEQPVREANASVIGYGDLEANNFDYAAVKAKGLQRTEGKEYVVKDGDVIEFLFNV